MRRLRARKDAIVNCTIISFPAKLWYCIKNAYAPPTLKVSFFKSENK